MRPTFVVLTIGALLWLSFNGAAAGQARHAPDRRRRGAVHVSIPSGTEL
jgi:hypothetical protein